MPRIQASVFLSAEYWINKLHRTLLPLIPFFHRFFVHITHAKFNFSSQSALIFFCIFSCHYRHFFSFFTNYFKLPSITGKVYDMHALVVCFLKWTQLIDIHISAYNHSKVPNFAFFIPEGGNQKFLTERHTQKTQKTNKKKKVQRQRSTCNRKLKAQKIFRENFSIFFQLFFLFTFDLKMKNIFICKFYMPLCFFSPSINCVYNSWHDSFDSFYCFSSITFDINYTCVVGNKIKSSKNIHWVGSQYTYEDKLMCKSV